MLQQRQIIHPLELGEIQWTVLFEVVETPCEISLHDCLSHLPHAAYEELLVFAALGYRSYL